MLLKMSKIMKNSQIFKKILFTAIIVAINFVIAANVKAVCVIGNNLILNGDAEADSMLAGSGSDHDLSGWEPETGTFTVVRYTTGGGFPTNSDPGPASRGNFFFAGGPQNGITSSGAQIINVADCSVDIDANRQRYNLSGFFGGFSSQSDTATLTITFRNSTNISIGSVEIGTVTPGDRGNVTGLLLRGTTGILPAGTRTVEVVLSMPPTGGYNDGYADNLSFFLTAPTAANVSISGRVKTANGQGIRNTRIQLINTTTNETRFAYSSTFGNYNFTNLEVGQTYVIGVSSKKFSFSNSSLIINLFENLTDVDFVADF